MTSDFLAFLRKPLFFGKIDHATRQRRVLWWVVIWRLLSLSHIPVVAYVRPGSLGSTSHIILVAGLAILYAAVFGFVSLKTKAGSKRIVQDADLLICALLMFLAAEPKFVLQMSYFSYSCLLVRQVPTMRKALPATVAISFAFVAALFFSGVRHQNLFGPKGFETTMLVNAICAFGLYYFVSFAFVKFTGILSRISTLEVEKYLAEQRDKIRGDLHDDLNATVNGMHLKIQSLRYLTKEEAKDALTSLQTYYERASYALHDLWDWLDQKPSGDLTKALLELKDEAEKLYETIVDITLPKEDLAIDPALEGEVFLITKQALVNALTHAQASKVSVEVRQDQQIFELAVSDNGKGFSEEELEKRQVEGGLGVKGMLERAERIRGRLEIDHSGGGTRVRLKITLEAGSEKSFKYKPHEVYGGVYRYLLRLRALAFGWMFFEFFLTWFSQNPHRLNLGLPLFFVFTALALDCLLWVRFGERVYRALIRRPWLITMEQIFIGALFFFSLQNSVSYFYSLYLFVAVVTGGLFMSVLGSVASVLIFEAIFFYAHVAAPESSVGTTLADRYETALTHMIVFLFLAVTAGLFGELLKNLEDLRLETIRQVLIRQKRQLGAETRQKLHSALKAVKKNLMELPGRVDQAALLHYDVLEETSHELRVRLRTILNSLRSAH